MPRWCDETATDQAREAQRCESSALHRARRRVLDVQLANLRAVFSLRRLAQLFCTASFACSSESSLNERLARRRPAGLANVATEVTKR